MFAEERRLRSPGFRRRRLAPVLRALLAFSILPAPLAGADVDLCQLTLGLQRRDGGLDGQLQARNPFFTEDARGFDVQDLQRAALGVMSDSDPMAPLTRYAKVKLRYYQTAHPPAALVSQLATMNVEERHQAAVEYAYATFTSPVLDRGFRSALTNELGRSSHSDGGTLSLLLPASRGVLFAAPIEMKTSTEAIRAIAARRGSWPERTRAPPGHPRTNAEDILRHEPIESIAPLGGGVNTTLLVLLADGTRAVFKPRAGEKSYEGGDPKLVSFNREVSAARILRRWLPPGGKVTAPPTVEVVLAHNGTSYGPGSLQLFLNEYATVTAVREKHHDAWKRLSHSPAWGESEARARTVDYIMGNHDRFPNAVHRLGNFKNILIDFDPSKPSELLSMGLIDNGLGRPGFPYFAEQEVPLRSDIPEDLKRTILRFDEKGFREDMKAFLPQEGIDDFVERLGHVRHRIHHGP